MDNEHLDRLRDSALGKQFWLKPIGPPKDHPDWAADETRTWTQREVEIHFAKNPVKIAVGAIVIAYRVRLSKLIYVAERLPRAEWSEEEIRSEYSRRRWPFHIKARNLTPKYGGVWKQYELHPFPLAKEYNELHPEDTVHLGSILRGNDKVRIPHGFAEFLLEKICDITREPTAEECVAPDA